MGPIYQRAELGDLDELVDTRLLVLRAANGLDEGADLRAVEAATRDYYGRALATGEHAAWLVYDGARFVGAGGVSFFQVMPTCCNPTGRKAYLMNLYTHPAYRRRGIARHTLGLLVEEARRRGLHHISLEATPMGRPLYEAYGFTGMSCEMELWI